MSRRRRGSGIAEFFEGFNQGYATVGKVLQDREMRKIMEASPEDVVRQRAATEDELGRARAETDAMAAQDAREFGLDSPLQYTLGNTVREVRGQRFLGQEYDKPLTQAQQDAARMQAMAGVAAKFGNPMEALKLRQQALQNEQIQKQGVLTDLQIARGQREEETQKRLDEVNDVVATYMRNRVRLGDDGQPLPLTDDDFVMAGKQRVFELANRGLFDQALAASREAMEHATRKIQAETAERQAAVRDAVARIAQGDFAAAMAAFNRFVPDGNIIQNVTQNRDGSFTLERISGVDGAKLPPVKVENLDRLVAAVQSIADPNALVQQIERTFRNDVETRRLRLAENADRRAGAQFAQGQADRRQAQAEAAARTEAAVNLYQENNPNATPAQLAAVRHGVIDAVPRTEGGNAPADVKLAQAALQAGVPGVTDMASALQWARGRTETTPQEMHREFVRDALKNMYSPQDAVKAADELMTTMGFVRQNGRWMQPPQGNGGSRAVSGQSQDAPRINSPEELARLPRGSMYTAPDGSVRIKQ